MKKLLIVSGGRQQCKSLRQQMIIDAAKAAGIEVIKKNVKELVNDSKIDYVWYDEWNIIDEQAWNKLYWIDKPL